MDSAEKLHLCLLRILNSNVLRLFGCLIYNFDIELINNKDIISDQEDTSNKTLDPSLTAMALIVNNCPKIIIFEQFIEEHTVEELIFIMVHEILHILGGHNIRQSDRNSDIFNLATDHVINTSIKKDIKDGHMQKATVPNDAFYIKKLENDNLTSEQVYDIIYKQSKVKSTTIGTVKFGIPQQGGSGKGNDSNNQNSVQAQVKLKTLEVTINGKKRTIIKDVEIASSSSASNADKNNNQTDDSVKRVIDSLKSEARALLSSGEFNKGNESGSITNLVKQLTKVEIPWTTLLERAICSKIVPDADNRSWRHLQKRMYTHGFTFPGISTEEKPASLVIVEDQSGSISDKEISKFASVIIQSVKYFDEVRIIKHDVRIHSDKTINANEVVSKDILFEAIGRGGTSHKHVFKAIEDQYLEGNSEISLIILLTDFYSDITNIWSTYEWTEEIPVTVILTVDTNVPKYVDPNPVLI